VEKQLRILKYYVVVCTTLLGIVSLAAFKRSGEKLNVDEITAKRISLLDSAGHVRITIEGSLPGRRSALSGLLFHHSNGTEAGGLVYRGDRTNGEVSAGAALTMDQYDDDQIVSLQYNQQGTTRSQGLTFVDRPDSLGPVVLGYYRTLDRMSEGPVRDSVLREMRAKAPPGQLAVRRLFVGRDTSKAATLSLSDRSGTPRLRLMVDSSGNAAIVFLDRTGKAVRTITP
jgi:hypothetical protein